MLLFHSVLYFFSPDLLESICSSRNLRGWFIECLCRFMYSMSTGAIQHLNTKSYYERRNSMKHIRSNTFNYLRKLWTHSKHGLVCSAWIISPKAAYCGNSITFFLVFNGLVWTPLVISYENQWGYVFSIYWFKAGTATETNNSQTRSIIHWTLYARFELLVAWRRRCQTRYVDLNAFNYHTNSNLVVMKKFKIIQLSSHPSPEKKNYGIIFFFQEFIRHFSIPFNTIFQAKKLFHPKHISFITFNYAPFKQKKHCK